MQNGNIVWLSGNGVGTLNKIRVCLLPSCTTSQPTTVLTTTNVYNDVDIYNNLIVYTEQLTNGFILGTYDLITTTNTLLIPFTASSITDVEIDNTLLALQVFLGPSLANIFLYDLSTSISIQVTNNPAGTSSDHPRLMYLPPLSYALAYHISSGTIATQVYTPGSLQLYPSL